VDNAAVDDVIAVEVSLADGGLRYFLTWGRVQDAIDGTEVSDIVLAYSRGCALGGVPVSARVCDTLREAADSPSAPYFYECYLSFCHQPVPYGDGYEAWRTATDEAMRAGMQISYCGRPVAAKATGSAEVG
jgi:hypothetical protein